MEHIFPFHVFGDLRRWLFGLNRRDREKWSSRPKPLRAQRRRALTPPSSPSPSRTQSNKRPIHDQEQSAFFAKLPLEIRLLIYQELLAPTDHPRLHIVSSDERLVSRRCVDNDPHHPSWYHKCCGRFLKRDATTTNNYFYPVGERINPHPVRIQILRSCRRVYSESIDVLYSQNVLSFRQSQTIVDLQRTILPQRLESIRSLEISIPIWDGKWARSDFRFPGTPRSLWWTAWETIADMKSLVNLHVDFSRWHDWESRFHDDQQVPDWNEVIQLLEPMKAICVPNFVLTLHWHVDQAEILRGVGDAAPFRVEFKQHQGKARRVPPIY